MDFEESATEKSQKIRFSKIQNCLAEQLITLLVCLFSI